MDPDAGVIARLSAGKRTRQQLASKDREIAALKQELDLAHSVRLSPVPSPEGKQVFFVVGDQKSGTTWLMKMLDAHPEILCQGEGRLFGRHFRQRRRAGWDKGYPPVSLYNAIASSEDIRSWIQRSVWCRDSNVRYHLNGLTRVAIEHFLTYQLSKSDKRMVGDKTVLLGPNDVKEIGTILPEAKVIHIIRDGRDVAVSVMHHTWNQAEDQGGTSRINPAQKAKREAYRGDPQGLLEAGGIFPDGWLGDYAASWRARVAGTAEEGPALLGENYAEVRYEDLLANPEGELGRLVGFLGADATQEVVGQSVGAATFEKLSGGRKRGEEEASFFRKGIAGDWKNVFTEKNKAEFKAAAGDLLVRMGYETDDNW